MRYINVYTLIFVQFGSINRSDIPIEKPLRPRRPVGDIQKHKAVKQLYLKPIATKLPEIDSSDTIGNFFLFVE